MSKTRWDATLPPAVAARRVLNPLSRRGERAEVANGRGRNAAAATCCATTVALEQITEEFGAGGGASATVVLQAPDGQTLTSAENSTAVTTVVAALGQAAGCRGGP